MTAKHKMKSDAPPLRAVYDALYRAWGPQHWWPARTRFEMIVGAFLTQNTAWTNVKQALNNLRRARALTPDAMHRASLDQLADWIRPAGYFRVKARRLRAFTDRLFADYDGKLDRLFALDTPTLRSVLLSVHGIGPETADSILLYAAQREQFVIDTYTRRMMTRHGWADAKASYDEVAALFVQQGPAGVAAYNEFHGLIVQLGKRHCRTQPDCATCPLQPFLPKGEALA